jgi:hypothetical protein
MNELGAIAARAWNLRKVILVTKKFYRAVNGREFECAGKTLFAHFSIMKCKRL